MLWTEKYRPATLQEFDGPDYIKHFLENAMANGHPHLLLYGPPGAGKTTIANLLGPTFSLNASDERGIETIRNKVKRVANTIKRQVILLDECENLTKDAQTCLRRILEDFPNTSFIFCTNYYSKIIAPLQSRLLKIKVVLTESHSLRRIGKSEGLCYSDEFYDELFRKCGLDLRKATTVLQGIKPVESLGAGRVGAVVEELIGRVPGSLLVEFMGVGPDDFRSFTDKFVFEGYSVLHFLRQLGGVVGGRESERSRFAVVLARAEASALSGVADELVLGDLCAKKVSIFGKNGEIRIKEMD